MTANQTPGLNLQLLGPPLWRMPDGREKALTKKAAALVAYVATHPTGVPLDEVSEMIWGGSVGGLEQALYQLRQRLPRRIVEQSQRRLKLMDDVHCDLLDDLSSWPTATLLARSIFLEGAELPPTLNDWVADQREQHLVKVCDELMRRCDELQSRGLAPQALRLARRLTIERPRNEAGWRLRMWMHYLLHDMHAAVESYNQLLAALPPGRAPGMQTQQWWQVVQRAAAAPPTPVGLNPGLQRPPQLVGRTTQWAAIHRAAALRQPFLLRGEGGIGKSRLLGTFLAQQGPSIIVDSVSGDSNAPYSTLALLLNALESTFAIRPQGSERAVLSAVMPEWRSRGEPVPTGEVQVLRVVRRLLIGASRRPAGLRAIGIDNLHHVDAASLDLCRKLAEGETGRLLHFGFAARVQADGALADALKTWRGDSPPLKVIDLPQLTQDETAELLRTLSLRGPAAAVSAATLYAQVGGNPRMLLETLLEVERGWDPEQPLPRAEGALAVLEHRIGNLPARALPLLQIAAVLGPDAGFAEQALAWPHNEYMVAQADLDAHLVMSNGAFVHDSMLDVALASLAPPQRLHWHAVAAAVLTHHRQVPRARVAAHWEKAEQWLPAGTEFRAAARQAENAGRVGEAHSLFGQAVACLHRASAHPEEFDALYESLPAKLLLHDVSPAKAVLDRLRVLAATSNELARLALAQALFDVSHYRRGDTALGSTARAVEMTEPYPDLHCEVLGLHAAALAQAGRFDAALEFSARALASAGAQGRPRMAREIATQRLYVCFEVSRIEEGMALCRDLMSAYESDGDQAGAAAMQGHLGLLLLSVNPAQAWQPALRACNRHREIDAAASGPMAVMHRVALASACCHLGQFDEALAALYEKGCPIGAALQTNIRAKVQLTIAHLRLLLADEQAAVQTLDPTDGDWPPAMRVQRSWVLARAARLRGDSADSHMSDIDTIHASHPRDALAHTAWLEWGRQGTASSVAAQLQDVAALYGQAGMTGSARSAKLLCVHRMSEFAEASTSAAVASLAGELLQDLRSGAGFHASTYLPEAWLIVGDALECCGLTGQAQEAWAAGRDWVNDATAHVPPESLEHFKTRNPVNRALTSPGRFGTRA